MARLFDRVVGSLSPKAAFGRAKRLAKEGQAAAAFPLFARAAQAGNTEAKYEVLGR